jgi:hypothetical protein
MSEELAAILAMEDQALKEAEDLVADLDRICVSGIKGERDGVVAQFACAVLAGMVHTRVAQREQE